jgi:hypothetical protein
VESLEESTEGIIAYPNPFQNRLRIEWTSADEPNADVYLFSMEGKLIYKQVGYVTESALEVDTSQFPEGVYLLTIQTPNRRRNIKLLKKQ